MSKARGRYFVTGKKKKIFELNTLKPDMSPSMVLAESRKMTNRNVLRLTNTD